MEYGLKLTTGGDDLLARAFLAATIGPFRRPQGRNFQVAIPAGASRLLVTNNTGNRVLFATAIAAAGAGQTVNYARTEGGGNPFPLSSAVAGLFILFPGETLYAGGLAAAQTFDVFSQEF